MSIKNECNQNFLETIRPEIIHKILINEMELDLFMFRCNLNQKNN